MPSTVRGNEYPTCHNFNKGFSCARTPCTYAHRCNKPGCGGITLGSGALLPLNQKSSHLHGLGSPTVSTIASATVASNFGGVITPVNVFNLQCALHSNPDRVLVNKLCLELREGAKIGYSGPRQFRFSRNLPNASLNPEVVTSNLAEEVAKGRTKGPFPSPNLRISKFHLSALFQKSTQTSFEQYFICPSPKQGPSV